MQTRDSPEKTSDRNNGSLAPRSLPSAGKQFALLQVGRAVAAIAVAIYHANDFVIPLRIPGAGSVWAGFGMGYAGVEFFFVLSGFIMMHVHSHEFSQPGRLKRFIAKRVTRIFPIYWIVLGGLVLLYQLDRDLGPSALRSPLNILSSFLLIPWIERPIMPVAWTLMHETLFYTLFCLFFLSRRLGAAAFLVWLIACLAAMRWPPANYFASFIASPYNLLFFFGIIVGCTYTRVSARFPAALVLAGLAGFLTVGLTEQYVTLWPLGLRTVAYGVSAMVVIAGLVHGQIAVPRAAVLLGDASYAVYLVHLPAMNMAAILLSKLGWAGLVSPAVLLTGLVTVSVVAGMVLHVAIERPILILIARRRRKEPSACPIRVIRV